MKATQLLHDLGQSLWLDNITRDILDDGTLKRYIDELSVTGLTSNPTIFDHAIKKSTAYDAAIRKKVAEGKSGEALFFELALEDLTRAADLFRPATPVRRRGARVGVDHACDLRWFLVLARSEWHAKRAAPAWYGGTCRGG